LSLGLEFTDYNYAVVLKLQTYINVTEL